MIAILDYDAGNLTSVELAVKHLGGDGRITREPSAVRDAERLIFPGQGAAGSAMANLKRLGLEGPLREFIASGRPVLGICIAHQLIFDHSDEDGGTDCLGVLPGRVTRFSFAPEHRAKIPQMGWNGVDLVREHPIFDGFAGGSDCYFVHSFYPVPDEPEQILAATDYEGIVYCSIAGRDNLVSTQFHVEKSGRAGLRLLHNFLAWDGRPC